MGIGDLHYEHNRDRRSDRDMAMAFAAQNPLTPAPPPSLLYTAQRAEVDHG